MLEFLRFFEKNGYKFSVKDFFSKEYISIDELIHAKTGMNLFVVYEKFIE